VGSFAKIVSWDPLPRLLAGILCQDCELGSFAKTVMKDHLPGLLDGIICRVARWDHMLRLKLFGLWLATVHSKV
jgi:hydrogenase/urease accessory protein HupE